jgi:hypothetical protein
MDEGFIKVYRKLFDHALWKEKREFSRAEAWIDLLATARYKEGTTKAIINDRHVEWGRGQLVAANRFLLSRWNWKSNSKVSSFLKMLVEQGMITYDLEQKIGRITICNYDSYNTSENTNQIAKQPKDFSEESIEYVLTQRLFEKIQERSPDHREPNYQTWCKSIDMLIRVDKKSPADVARVIDWCQSDAFWQNNILSTDKLRAKFDQLKLNMDKKANGTNRQFSKKPAKGSILETEYREQISSLYSED